MGQAKNLDYFFVTILSLFFFERMPRTRSNSKSAVVAAGAQRSTSRSSKNQVQAAQREENANNNAKRKRSCSKRRAKPRSKSGCRSRSKSRRGKAKGSSRSKSRCSKKGRSKSRMDSSTKIWLAKHTKDCPKCETTIERRRRTCNHMTCAICSYEFCWVCLGPWSRKTHKYFFQCNRRPARSESRSKDLRSASKKCANLK